MRSRIETAKGSDGTAALADRERTTNFSLSHVLLPSREGGAETDVAIFLISTRGVASPLPHTPSPVHKHSCKSARLCCSHLS